MGLSCLFFNRFYPPALKTGVLTLFLYLTGFQLANAAPTILVWGDSLSAAYGIPREQSWVNLMQQSLGDKVKVENGSISGETSKGGLTRLPDALDIYQPDIVILELGANDGLRGFPLKVLQDNLQQMIELSKKAGANIVLLGMKIPPNYGQAYAQKFEAVFSNLAEKNNISFVPFFMQEVVQNLDLLQHDELHPTAEAQPLLLKQVLPEVKNALQTLLVKS